MERDTRLLVDLLRDRQFADRSLGQHYLIDDNILEASIEMAGNLNDVHVLEIGCGPGTLTRYLLHAGARVTAIEIDPGSIEHMYLQFEPEISNNRLSLAEGDALVAPWPDDVTALVANIPYQISSPLLERIQRDHLALSVIVLLVQEEFANRMSMQAGPIDRGPLGMSLWLDFDVEIGRKVPSSSFSPQPQIHSRLVRLNPVNRLNTLGTEIDRRLFRQIVSQCFSDRRRKLRNLLKRSPRRLSRIPGWHRERWQQAIARIHDHPLMELRPEMLEPTDWVSLCEDISAVES
ncbi:MAG: 16S rRNA (adenine(1518)-N(6)/adenine(1519)-N(6))-dimethyltransferase RsmA [Candidatus Thalassarchaeaceae archaeon]|jgi:16S rRNA (adenine1518-N6/adenine1519-N6)-dimethyltransferase|nr:16S rRNA (adenine(1518)-N(6)/adenine(1519)-N(6))-dimethyltransferase RsmA [Candidatus Thalassarchaeaceae archaeon]